MFSFLKKIGCVLLGHYWVFVKDTQDEIKYSTFRSGIAGQETYQAHAVYVLVDKKIWRCRHCNTHVKTKPSAKPSNARRRIITGLFKWSSYRKLLEMSKKR